MGFKNGGKIKLPAIYESASYFHDGYAVVRLNDFLGVIDTEGNFVIPNRYSDVTYLFGDYYCIRINILQNVFLNFTINKYSAKLLKINVYLNV